jgi:hypothetical protein
LIFRIRKAVAVVALLSTGIAFFSSPMFGAAKLAFTYYDPFSITEYRLRRLSTEEISAKIKEAIAQGEFDDAVKLVEIGQQYGHSFDPELIARSRESALDATLRNSMDFADGFVSGKVSSPASFGGAMAADYLIFGDLRDIATEGTKAITGEDYDTLTLGLSLVGVATLVPGTGPIDAGASVIKNANKAGILSKRMAAVVDGDRARSGRHGRTEASPLELVGAHVQDAKPLGLEEAADIHLTHRHQRPRTSGRTSAHLARC